MNLRILTQSFLFAGWISLLGATAIHAAEIEGIEVLGYEDNAYNLSLLVKWGYYDEALAWRKKYPEWKAAQSEHDIRAARTAFLRQIAKYNLPSNSFPEIAEYSFDLTGDGKPARLLVYCLKERKLVWPGQQPIPEFIRLLADDGQTVNDVSVGECRPKASLSTMTVVGKSILVAFEPGSMAEGYRYYQILNGKLVSVMREEANGAAKPLEATTPFHGPPFKDFFSADRRTFSESTGGWDHEKRAEATRTSTYEWRGSSYVFVNSATSYEEPGD